MMLVLTRKFGERVYIGDDIVITVVEIDRGRVRLGFEAPPHVKIYREEHPARGGSGEGKDVTDKGEGK
jgi:carbon storage regulator